MRIIFILGCFLLIVTSGYSQSIQSKWTLEDCVQYAIDHNISIRQDSLNTRSAKYTLLQSKLQQLPSISTSGDYGRSYGRSINPTTNQFVEGDYNFFGLSGQANLVVFGWMQIRNSIEKSKYALQASLCDLDQLKDDISLNVANGFLAAVLAKEQIQISLDQVQLSQAQLDQTRKFAESGRLPELNVAQLESQVASDSSTLINAITNYTSSLLDLKTLLNLDLSQPFDIQMPEVEVGGVLEVTGMQPEDIYVKARAHFGSVKGSEYRVKSAEKALAAAKGGLYPQLSVGVQSGTNWASNYDQYSYTPNGFAPSGFSHNSANHNYDTVFTPSYNTVSSLMPFGTQLNNNLRSSLFVNLNIPIFNAWQSQYAVRQARITLETNRLNEYSSELTLKQNVYKAHNNVIGSIQKYNAAKRADEAAQRAYDFAQKRYDLGLTSTVDLLVTQNSKFVAAANLVIAKYDLVFKMKVIDYYLGKALKL